MFRFKRTDLPLEQDANGRFLPWLIALMVFLAVIAFGILVALQIVILRWDQGIGNTISIQLIQSRNLEKSHNQLQKILNILAVNKDIQRYEVVSDQQIIKLLEPWLGDVSETLNFPLPLLIDVELKHDAVIDADTLQKQLNKKIKGVVVDDHRIWLVRFIYLINSAQLIVFIVLGFVLLAMAGTIVFVTRTGLEIHREAIEVLHFIGAQDVYIAKQFAGRAMVMSFRGGMAGSCLGVLALLILGYFLGKMQNNFFIEFHLEFLYIGFIVGLPIAIGLIARIVAHVTVLRLLSRIP